MRSFIYLLFLYLVTSMLIAQPVPEKWITKFESSGFLESPDYNETMAYFQALAEYSDYATIKSMGKTPQGRDIKYIIVSKIKEFTPESARKNGKAIMLILNGIHSGEINGKDASMLLLRDILVTKEKEDYIDHIDLIIVPIFSVDAHERRGAFNRINQIGPKEMGWRVTAQNLNLNRDFMKADAPEMQHFLKLYNEWLPDFFIDVHSTDGADYQYQTTYAIEKHENAAPNIAEWVKNEFNPFLIKSVNDKGFLISPFVGFVEGDASKGVYDWLPLPRFSNGYAAVQNRAGLLIESHILKTYKERVYSTKSIFESVIELINSDPVKITELGRDADKIQIKKFISGNEAYPLDFKRTKEHDSIIYKAIKEVTVPSVITGSTVNKFTGENVDLKIPYYNHGVASVSVNLPDAYIIPQEWQDVINRLEIHGVNGSRIVKDNKFIVERYKFTEVEFPKSPYEGRFLPDYKYVVIKDTIVAEAGDYIVPTDQRRFGIIAHLLEPLGEDSFMKWGFFNIIFERKEYYEDYAMEPIAQKMYNDNTRLRDEFNAKVNADTAFAKNARARLDFFYANSPYYDDHYNFYPVLRVIGKLDD